MAFGSNKVVLVKIIHTPEVMSDLLPPLPARGELQWWNTREEIQHHRRSSKHKHKLGARLSEACFGDLNERDPELPKGDSDPTGIPNGRLDPKIEILGEARLGVVDDGITTHNQIAHPMPCEAL